MTVHDTPEWKCMVERCNRTTRNKWSRTAHKHHSERHVSDAIRKLYRVCSGARYSPLARHRSYAAEDRKIVREL
jgi:hypothetical protein